MRGGGISGLLGVTIVAGMFVLVGSGCDNAAIDPFIEGEHFTVWGFISSFQDTHYVRVIPVRRFPEEINAPSDPHAEIDAVVTTTDVSTGRTVEWSHSLERLDDRTFGHIFRAVFSVRAGARYRLTVTRSDGAKSVAETVVPSGAEAEVIPAEVVGDRVFQTIRWKDVPTSDNMYLIYCAGPLNSRACADGGDGGGLNISYGRQGARVGNDWEVVVELSRDFAFLRTVSGIPPEVPIGLFSLQMRLNTLDEGWRVLSDPNDFAQPGALDNVEGGFGYFGSIGNSILDWFPEEEALATIGVTPQPEGG